MYNFSRTLIIGSAVLACSALGYYFYDVYGAMAGLIGGSVFVAPILSIIIPAEQSFRRRGR